jgi:hypothetical protein
MPGMASSKLIESEIGLYRSALGFQINSGGSGWIQMETPADKKTIETTYHAPKTEPALAEALAAAPKAKRLKVPMTGEGASLTVRVDNLDKNLSLEQYLHRWLKEYPRYGFDILNSKSFTQNSITGQIVDLVNQGTKNQLRQVIFVRNNHAVILTCRDALATFRESINGCNQIIRTFKW